MTCWSRYLFLDIDGVLNHTGCWGPGKPAGEDRIDPACVERLQRVYERTGCSIVVSSTWLFRPVRALAAILERRGYTGPVVDKTPERVPDAKLRGQEIQAWMDEWGVPPERIAIVDDDADMGDLLPRLVQTRFDGGGLTDEVADRLVQLLREAGPARIKRRRRRGWKMPGGAVYVGRPGRWGNPYTRIMASSPLLLNLDAYRVHIAEQIRTGALDLAELRGRDLACWCQPGHACHADVLLGLANGVAK